MFHAARLAASLLALVALVALAPTLPAAAAPEGPFRDAAFADALAAAKKEQKVVFVDFFTTWCGPCKRLDATTWKDAAVVKWLGEATIPLKLDAEVEVELAKRYAVRSYPTMVFIGPDGAERGRIVGYRDAEAFLAEAPARLAGRTALDEIEARLVGNERDVRLRFERGKELARVGRGEEALVDLLFCYDEGREEPGFRGVRLSYLLRDIMRLGGQHPPALTALRERRAAATKRVLAEDGDLLDAQEVAALNRSLGDHPATLNVWEQLRHREGISEFVLDTLFEPVVNLLLAARRYQDVIEGAGDVFGRIASAEELLASFEEREAELPQSRAVDYLRTSKVDECAKVHEALLGVGDEKTAERLVARLLEFDPSASCYARLARSAARVERFDLARALLQRGFREVPRDEVKVIERANRRLPKAERLETK